MADTTAAPAPARNPKRRQASSIRAEARFRARVAELGGEVTGSYVHTRTAVEVVCAAGHRTTVRPADLVNKRTGLCRTCAGKDPRAAEAAFRARVAELGGTVTGTYRNRITPIEVVCKRGHAGRVWPCSVLSGQGICRTCVGRDPRKAEAAFRARIAELGGTVVGRYANALTPVAVTCAEGHRCTPRPHDVATGNGICWTCKGRSWDAFYVVQNAGLEVVKFGITNADPRPRLREHARDGLDQVVRLHTNMPGDTARPLERTILAALRDCGEEPVRGREYFPGRVLPLVLNLVDNHPALRPLPSVSLPASRREQLALW